MTRIKYTKPIHGWIFSQQILCNTKIVVITLDLDTLTYHVMNGKEKLKEGQANTLTSLKRKAKQAVKELGAFFYDEIRNRGTTERIEL
jgi:hypothetical protein